MLLAVQDDPHLLECLVQGYNGADMSQVLQPLRGEQMFPECSLNVLYYAGAQPVMR
jgi:hypothetical protein